ncbi:MAG: NTP pyrophosphohydrolase [Schaalia georgiae]|uniref:NTP pyrophosphohydrolase n=1 Tax=Schaalia georgiae TaxID=52768 RepID=A0A929N0B1_9ACTO|nr:NTP pyrophosphohydrolase [Schaalia georgiae]
MKRFATSVLHADVGEVEQFSLPQTPQSIADDVCKSLTAPRYFDGSRRFAMVVWALPEGAAYPEDAPEGHPARSTYIQCAGSTRAMTIEIRLTHQDGSYQHWAVAREPVTDPDKWVDIEWDTSADHPSTTRVHPEEVFTGDQAALVFHDYIVDGTLPPTELLRPIDI